MLKTEQNRAISYRDSRREYWNDRNDGALCTTCLRSHSCSRTISHRGNRGAAGTMVLKHLADKAARGLRRIALPLLPSHDGRAVDADGVGEFAQGDSQLDSGGGDFVHARNECISHSVSQVPNALAYVQNGDMETPGERLRKARLKAGYKTVASAARALGVSRFTYAQHENNTQGRGIPRESAIRYSKFFRLSLDTLLTDARDLSVIVQVPVVSYIGAGAEVYPVDDYPKGQGVKMVAAPPGVTDCVAARVQGDSMYPLLRKDWLVFWHRDQEGVPGDCLGRLCVVQVKDGPLLVKDLARGSQKGRFNLISVTEPLRENVELEWAARVIDIRPS